MLHTVSIVTDGYCGSSVWGEGNPVVLGLDEYHIYTLVLLYGTVVCDDHVNTRPRGARPKREHRVGE